MNKLERAIDDLRAEIMKAREKFPNNDHLQAAMGEEYGEAVQALMELQYEPSTLKTATSSKVYKECIQVACTALRLAIEGDSTFPTYDAVSGQFNVVYRVDTGQSFLGANLGGWWICSNCQGTRSRLPFSIIDAHPICDEDCEREYLEAHR